MAQPMLSYPGRNSLREHLFMGLYIAAGFSALALIGVTLGTVNALIRRLPLPPGGLWTIAVVLGTAILGYFVAGIVASTAVWALRPLRRWVLGWVLTGILVATVAYGCVGLLGSLLYVNAGINIFDFRSPAEAWRTLPLLTIGIGVLAGVPGGLYFWWKRPWG